MDKERIIIVKDLVKRFGDFTANDHLNFEVYKGEIFGFLGANGAGKTTAMKILCGLSKPTSGEANIAGLDIYKDTHNIRKIIGYMSQRFSLYEDLTVYENIRFFAGIYGIRGKEFKKKVQKLIEKLNIQNVAHTLVGAIPLGWKQKLAFSIAMFHEPPIVFLDEPTSGVDPHTRRQFWEMIYQAAEEGVTVFVTTHYMDEAEYCDRVSIMDHGKIAALDTPAKLRETAGAVNMNDVFLKLVRPQKAEL
ncbi:MAG: ABC transporter [Marinilabiliales bacterium]|nr:MAG: ABC transporter [Marinilabiliales bacterium]